MTSLVTLTKGRHGRLVWRNYFRHVVEYDADEKSQAQREAYRELMGHEPPEQLTGEGCEQFNYTPRSKFGRAYFARFVHA